MTLQPEAGPVTMMFGDVVFRAWGFGYVDFSRDIDTSWAAVEVAGQLTQYQWTGPKSDTMKIGGVLVPKAVDGMKKLLQLRLYATNGEPKNLMARTGAVIGKFIISNLSHTGEYYDESGAPALLKYDMTLLRYSPFDDALAQQIVKAEAKAAPTPPPEQAANEPALGSPEHSAARRAEIAELRRRMDIMQADEGVGP